MSAFSEAFRRGAPGGNPPELIYHAAPAGVREAIEAQGLLSQRGRHCCPGQVPGVFGHGQIMDALAWGLGTNRDHNAVDVWAVDLSAYDGEINYDEWATDSWRCGETVPPRCLRRLSADEVAQATDAYFDQARRAREAERSRAEKPASVALG